MNSEVDCFCEGLTLANPHQVPWADYDGLGIPKAVPGMAEGGIVQGSISL